MSRKDDCFIRQGSKSVEAFIHLFRVRSRKISATAALEKKCVASDEAVVHEETLTAWCVARGMDQTYFNLSDLDCVARLMLVQVINCYAGSSHHPFGLEFLYVNWDINLIE